MPDLRSHWFKHQHRRTLSTNHAYLSQSCRSIKNLFWQSSAIVILKSVSPNIILLHRLLVKCYDYNGCTALWEKCSYCFKKYCLIWWSILSCRMQRKLSNLEINLFLHHLPHLIKLLPKISQRGGWVRDGSPQQFTISISPQRWRLAWNVVSVTSSRANS